MIVLPMAGLSSRFFHAGYAVPKYMLDLHGRTVFAHALGGFAELFEREHFLVICRDVFDTPAFVRAEAARLGLSEDRLELVTLDGETAGQAETVALGVQRSGVPADTPLTIFNIDTFRPGFRHPEAFDWRAVDGYLEVFTGEGEHWSFVKPDAAEPAALRVAEVAEKMRISDLCSDGLYHFRTTELFLSLYAEIEGRDPATLQGGERYVAPLYDIALRRGCDIRYALVPAEAIRFCGTPEEYEALRSRPSFPPVVPSPPSQEGAPGRVLAEAAGAAPAALDAALEAAKGRLAEGDPVGALARLARLLEAHPEDPRPHHAAFRALVAALEHREALAAWDAAEKAACWRRLVLQPDCPERPLILHHGLASLITSGNVAAAAALVAELLPGLRAMLAEGPPPLALILFLLVGRAWLGDRIEAARLSALHEEAFPHFGAEDLALPYSTMFNPKVFGPNRDDVLRRFGSGAEAASLRPSHLLLIEWLGAHPLFKDPENRDLAAALGRGLAVAERRETELPAARSLVARHWRLDGVLTAARLAELGLGPEAVALAERLARARSAWAASAPTGPTRLERRPYQALQAARNLVARRLPALNRAQRRVRVAVCVSGQLRGYRSVLPSWRRTLLADVDCELFIHSWRAVGRAGAQPFRAVLPFEGRRFTEAWRRIGTREGYEEMRTRHPALFAALEAEATVSREEVHAVYGTPHVHLEDDAAPPFVNFSNQRKMHYKIWAAQKLADASSRDYDLVMRIRPDLGVALRAFDWLDLRQACAGRPLLFTEREFGVHYGQPMIGDQFALGSPEAMRRYAETWKIQPELAAAGLAHCAELQGHASLAQLCWLSGLRVARAPIRFTGLREPAPLPAREIERALRTDAEGRMDAIDRELMKAIRADLS